MKEIQNHRGSHRSQRTVRDYIGLAARGFAMGAADVVPGVSGGTMAFILGIYDELIQSIRAVSSPNNLKHIARLQFRQTLHVLPWRFLLAVGSGMLLAVFWAIADAAAQETGQKHTSLLDDLSGKIVFQSDRDGDWDIYVMNADGSNVIQLTHNAAADEYPVWSPDGEQIAFKSNRDGNFDIYVMNADGTDQKRLTNHPSNDEDPAWSPDGQNIVFHSNRKSGLEIYMMNANGSGLTQFTQTIGKNGLPAWSPDGQRLAYTGNRYLGWNVYVTNLDKTDDHRITDGHGACRPDWSPDGTRLAYVSQEGDDKGDIWLINPDGSGKTRLTLDDVNYDYHPEWSPDGEYIAYDKTSDKNTGNWEIYVMTADGQSHARITNHPARDSFPNWTKGNVADDWFMQQTFVYEAESSPRTIGNPKEDSDASKGQAVYGVKTDPPGFLVFGPYQSFEPAEYVAYFRLKTARAKSRESVVLIDVVTDAGQTTIVEKKLSGHDFRNKNRYQEFELPFSLKEPKTLEFRVLSFGKENIWVDKVTVAIKTRLNSDN